MQNWEDIGYSWIIFFIYLKVKLLEGKIKTDLYIKETDRHQYLHYNSSHPNHTKRSIVFSQALRMKRNEIMVSEKSLS